MKCLPTIKFCVTIALEFSIGVWHYSLKNENMHMLSHAKAKGASANLVAEFLAIVGNPWQSLELKTT
jgi:hypothetical protein